MPAKRSHLRGRLLVEMENKIVAVVAANEGAVARRTKPDAKAKRARRFALRVAPDLGYLCGVLGQVAQEMAAESEKPMPPMLGFLPHLTRFGFQTPYHYALWRDSGRSSRGATQTAFKELEASLERAWSDDWNVVKNKLEGAQLKAMLSRDLNWAENPFESFLTVQEGKP